MIYKNHLPKIFGIDFNLMKKFIVTFFCFFAVNFIIFYNEYFINYSIVKYTMLVIFDILLVIAVYYLIKLNCVEIEAIAIKVFLSAGALYIFIWFTVYVFKFSWFPPLRSIAQFIADAIFVSVMSAVLIICSLYQNKKNSDMWEKKYLITLNIIMCIYSCLLYCADLFTELSRAYISPETNYPYLYDPIFIIFIIVNIYTAGYLVLSVRQASFSDSGERSETGTAKQEVLTCLSARETEVINLIAKGMNNAEIADELCISVYTVKRHVNNIFKKLEVKNRFELLYKMQNNK